jgi:hypothetical protein
MALQQIQVPWRPGYDFGVGADLLSGGPLALVVDGTPTGVQQAGGSTVNFELQRIHTTSDLEQSLGVDVDASYGCAAFGAGASARFSFAKSSSVQTSSLFMTVTATVSLQFLQIDGPTLNVAAAGLVDRPDLFEPRYGNVFVRGITRGGLFVGVLRINTRSSDDSQAVSAELQGTYGLFSADAQTKFAEVQKKYQSEIFVQMYHEGGPTDLKITDATNPMELLNNANTFLQSFADRPGDVAVPYQVTLAPMSVAVGPPPLNAADIVHAQDVLVFCAHRRNTILDQLNLMQFMADNSSRFDYPAGVSPAIIQTAVTGLQGDLDLVSQCASGAINSPTAAVMPADYASSHGIVFPQGKLPDVMPVPKSGQAPSVPVTIPAWSSDESLGSDAMDGQGNVVTRSAGSLGLIVEEVWVNNGTGNMGDVVSIAPPAGTQVMSGSTVVVAVQRNPGPHDV